MRKKLEVFCLAVVFAAGAALPVSVFATNGYKPHGQGPRTKAIGGAGVAFPQDSIIAATNPAGMVLVGARYDVGAAVFNPNRSYSYVGDSPFIATAAQESGSTTFLIPHFGINWALDETSTIGLTVYGAGGLNVDYASPVYSDSSGQATNLKASLEQLIVSGTYAIDLGDIQIGGSLLMVRQVLNIEGLQGFDNALFSGDPGSVTNNGDDSSLGFGVKLGIMAKVGDGIRLGASYQPKVDMEKFDKYSGLLAEGGDLDVPATYTVGAAFEISGNMTFVADYTVINYSDVAAISNPGETLIGAPTATSGGFPVPPSENRLGEADGMGFGWDDVNIIRGGVVWKMDDDLTIRGGINQGDNPVKPDQTFFNLLTPAVTETHLTGGFSVGLDESSEFTMAFMHALENSTTGELSVFLGGGTNTLTMDQNEIELSYSQKF